MPTYEQILSKLNSMDGLSKVLGKREIKELPKILWEDEEVEKIVQGMYSNGMGILVATNKRLVFVDKGLLGSLKVEDFPYDKISSIQYETNLLYGKITIFTSGNRAIIDHIEKKSTRDFGDYVRARATKASPHASMQTAAPAQHNVTPPEIDIVSQLERLATLKEKGILTESEFQEQKRKLIG